MGELDEPRWAVISERGREATGITYAEAARLVRELAAQKLSGVCVVTDAAARRLGEKHSNDPASPAKITRRKSL